MVALTQSLRTAAVASAFWALLLIIEGATPVLASELHRLDEWQWRMAAISFIFAMVFLSAVPIYRLVLWWLRKQHWLPVDGIISFAGIIGGIIVFVSTIGDLPMRGLRWNAIFTVGMAVAVIARAGYLWRCTSRRIDPHPKNEMAALDSIDEDELDRGKVVDELYDLVSQAGATSINFGLEGPWGSGKTSLLNMLSERLRARGFTVLRFDMWSYREPERLVRVYFDQLGTAIDSEAPHLRTRRLLRKLARGLANIGGDRVYRATEALLTLEDHSATLDEIRISVAEALSSLSRPLVVLLDDLDRLDRDELQAVLRAVRLMSELPNLTQMIAYDRQELARILFAEDSKGIRARDYLGKIVTNELTLGAPPRELAARMFNRALTPFVESLGSSDAQNSFVQRVQREGQEIFPGSLPTPREIRRVAAAAEMRWRRLQGHVNPFDLLLLIILQYRHPHIFRRIRSNPEWFVELAWTADIQLRLSEPSRQRFAELGRSFWQTLRDGDLEEVGASRILLVLFPALDSQIEIDEEDARRGRRIMHPIFVERYFNLYIPDFVISELQMETYAEELLRMPAGADRQQRLVRIIEEEAARGRLDSFLEQWNLVFGQAPAVHRHDEPLVRDLSLGIARCAHHFSAEPGFWFTPQQNVAAFKAIYLGFHLSSNDSFTSLLVEVIRHSSSLAFGGIIVSYSVRDAWPAEFRGGPVPDEGRLRDEFVEKILTVVGDDPSAFFRLSRSDREAVLFSSGGDPRIGGIVMDALRHDPLLLPNLLIHATHLRITSEGTEVAVETFNASVLAEVVALEDVYQITRQIAPEIWQEDVDRRLVEEFRQRRPWQAESAEEEAPS